ncbi:MAG: FimB/Mfa2 family fimbrial subunit [Paludibacteraceae bacterium]|nr:FimB/Mfa2 family fimbrial subunit [Paludibacteraceae bacterium]
MKKNFTLLAIISVFAVVFATSCKTNDPQSVQMVDVTVSFTGIDIQVTPENAPMRIPAASDKNATQAKVKRISLSAYDATTGNLISSASQNQNTDATNFGTITMRIPVGSYKFVAVADTVSSSSSIIINSISEISLGSAPVCNPTYTTVQDVTIAGNTSQVVIIDMGVRKNASIVIKTTDQTPATVDSLEVIIAPTSSFYTNLLVNPATGFATSQWKYRKSASKSVVSGSFMNKSMLIPLMLTAASQQINVVINAKNSNNEILFTRTLENVPFQQGHRTVASGTFFSPEATSSFTFDVTEISDNISLD